MSNEIAFTVYRTTVAGEVEYEGPDKETAIRTWDSLTFSRANVPGGIEVQSFNSADVMVRDGWLLHVSESGHVYLNPRP